MQQFLLAALGAVRICAVLKTPQGDVEPPGTTSADESRVPVGLAAQVYIAEVLLVNMFECRQVFLQCGQVNQTVTLRVDVDLVKPVFVFWRQS